MAAGQVTRELRCLVGRLYIRSLDITEAFIAYANGRFAAEAPATAPAGP